MLIYFIGFVFAFILMMLIRHLRFGKITVGDIMASLICAILAWFTVVFILVMVLCVLIWYVYDSAKDVVIFSKKDDKKFGN